MSGPGTGQVTMIVKTASSGTSQGFHFTVTPVLDGAERESRKYFFPGYQNGTFVTILVEGLKQGQSYQFSVAVANSFGASLPTLSVVISAGVGK